MNEETPVQSNQSYNCTGYKCFTEEEALNILQAYIFPTITEWVFIIAHLVVFVVGLVGNVLVSVAVCRNKSMRTVTNYFIFNLSVADFMVILFCLPTTVVWDVTGTWFFGDALCKVIPYLQTVSVTVSVLTLTGISMERWYAICYPMKFKATTTRAKRVIIVIWIISLLFDTPELVVLHTKEQDVFNFTTVYLTQCEATSSAEYEMTLVFSRALALYLIPLGSMTFAYYKIVCVLWSPAQIQVPEDVPIRNSHTDRSSSNDQETTRYLMPISRGRSDSQSNAIYSQLKARRKAAKMLVAVVILFAVCYLPIHIFCIIAVTNGLPQTEVIGAIAMTGHWLTYANSAVNPIYL